MTKLRLSIPPTLARSCLIAALNIGVCQSQDLPNPNSPVEQRKVEDVVDGYKKFDLKKIGEVLEAFLKAGTVTERAKYVRDPKRVAPLMKKYYGGEKFEAEGFESFNNLELSYRGDLLTTLVETSDFMEGPVAVERIAGDPDVYRVDWESWVGYCEMTIEELKKARSKKPVMVRCILKRDSYFNYGFSDDEIWDSYRLGFKGTEESLAGYAKADSDLGRELQGFLKNTAGVPLILKVSYPKGARSETQVEIVEVISEGWVGQLPGIDEEGK